MNSKNSSTGSTGKAFTVAALAVLVDQGKLKWDDRVIDHIPWFAMYDPWVTREMTVRDLLVHRSRGEAALGHRQPGPAVFRGQGEHDPGVQQLVAGHVDVASLGPAHYPAEGRAARRVGFQPLHRDVSVRGMVHDRPVVGDPLDQAQLEPAAVVDPPARNRDDGPDLLGRRRDQHAPLDGVAHVGVHAHNPSSFRPSV